MWQWINDFHDWQWMVLYLILITAVFAILAGMKSFRDSTLLRLDRQIFWLRNLKKAETHYLSGIQDKVESLRKQMEELNDTISKLPSTLDKASQTSEITAVEPYLKNITEQLQQIDAMLSTSIDTSLESIAYDLDMLTLERTKQPDLIAKSAANKPPGRTQPGKTGAQTNIGKRADA